MSARRLLLAVILAALAAPVSSAGATCNLLGMTVVDDQPWFNAASPAPQFGATIVDDEGTRLDFFNESTSNYYGARFDGAFGWYFSIDPSALAQGANSVRTALFCRSGTAVARAYVNYDSQPPAVTFAAPAEDSWQHGAVRLVADGADATSGIALYRFGVAGRTIAASSGQIEADTSVLGDGNHTVTVQAIDAAGNVSATSERTFRVDDTSPGVTLADPGAVAVDGTLALAAAATDAGSGVGWVRFERAPAGSGSWSAISTDRDAAYTASLNTVALADGDYDVRAVAADALDNERTSPSVVVHVHNGPVNATAPGVVGQPVVGSRLTSTTGTWTTPADAPRLSVLWQRCADDGACSPVDVGDGYTPTVADVGRRLRSVVTAINTRGRAVAVSSPTAVVAWPALDATSPAAISWRPGRSGPGYVTLVSTDGRRVTLRATIAPRVTTAGGLVLLRGRLQEPVGTPAPTSIAVRLLPTSRQGRRFAFRAAAHLDPLGRFSFGVRPLVNGHIELRIAALAVQPPIVLELPRVGVRPRIGARFTVAAEGDGTRRDLHVAGRIAPALPGLRLTWEGWVPGLSGPPQAICTHAETLVVASDGTFRGTCHARHLSPTAVYRMAFESQPDAPLLDGHSQLRAARLRS